VKNLWDASSRAELSNRLSKLTPDAKAAWGKMSATEMLAHLVDSLRMATGELPAKQEKLPIRFTPLKQLIIYGPPFPKNSPTSPELRARKADEWDMELSALKQMMESFAARPAGATLPRHPAFGNLSRRTWGALSYKHIDHHFKQFGV
jgi:hypothetical protein